MTKRDLSPGRKPGTDHDLGSPVILLSHNRGLSSFRSRFSVAVSQRFSAHREGLQSARSGRSTSVFSPALNAIHREIFY